MKSFLVVHGMGITFIRSVSNHHIDDESLKVYFYRGQDDNGKVMIDTIAEGSCSE